jgi:3-deoxy-D-manno-oct-2-ulosonic acid (Kdo) hydroxylase
MSTSYNEILRISHTGWDTQFPAVTQEMATSSLEDGAVVMLPGLEFSLSEAEKKLLDPRVLGKAKNVAYTPWTGKISHTTCVGEEAETMRAMIARYSDHAQKLMKALFPHYQSKLKVQRASFRPAEIAGRKSSWRKDDTRLHVDAFPASPVYGERIIRMFCNVNPHGKPRVWRLGEPFENVAKRFLPGIGRPFPGSAQLMYWVRLTKKPRSEYDHYMTRIHDSMKSDMEYQRSVGQAPIEIAPGTTWITFTDSVSHAALSGQHQFEQTFALPVAGMHDPSKSPLRILERLTGRALI